MHYLSKLDRLVEKEQVPQKLGAILRKFYFTYCSALLEHNRDFSLVEPLLIRFLELVVEQLKKPYVFEPFHKRILHPFNYYQFGLDFIRPLVIFEKSHVEGLVHVDQMAEQLERKENVILFANHQIEPDPQAINLLLEHTHPEFVQEMIFVAGHRVTTDPLAVPFSKGCNLFCIYSKKHIETPPEEKEEKVQHNQKTMKLMQKMLQEGGRCIYVAPSGGRDRPDEQGFVDVAPFDPQSIELFYLMASKSEKKTHFYPLSLVTYNLLPPPHSVEVELGERRQPQCTPIHLSFGEELDMESYPGCDDPDKKTRRMNRAEHIWKLVQKDYLKLLKENQ